MFNNTVEDNKRPLKRANSQKSAASGNSKEHPVTSPGPNPAGATGSDTPPAPASAGVKTQSTLDGKLLKVGSKIDVQMQTAYWHLPEPIGDDALDELNNAVHYRPKQDEEESDQEDCCMDHWWRGEVDLLNQYRNLPLQN